MCSSRCDRPASGSSSVTEPVPIQNPRATDRTESMDSVTTRTPEGRVVRRCNLGALGVAPAARAAGAARPAVAAAVATVAAAPPPAAAAAATVPPATRAAAPVAGAHGGELLDGLARDVRVVRQPQADAAALAVDLDHADLDLVALVEDLLDRVGPLARRDVGDVQEAVGALGELDERAEGRRLHDLAVELVADLDLLHHRADVLGECVAQLTVGGVDEDLAL